MLYLVHPFASSRHFTHREACHWIRGSLLSPMNPVPLPPQGETRDMRKKQRVIYFRYHFGVSPFGGCTTTFPVEKSGTVGKGEASVAANHQSAYHAI